MKVHVDIEETEFEGDYSSVDGILATCSRCNLKVEVYGTEEASKKRACATLKEDRLRGEKNYYTY